MKISNGAKEYEAVFNGFTPIAYSRCFSEKTERGTMRPKDIADAVSKIADSLITYDVPAITPLLEIFYACIKTADISREEKQLAVGFDDWVSEFPAESFDLQNGDGWATDVMHIVEENFFPKAKEHVDAETAEETGAAATK